MESGKPTQVVEVRADSEMVGKRKRDLGKVSMITDGCTLRNRLARDIYAPVAGASSEPS